MAQHCCGFGYRSFSTWWANKDYIRLRVESLDDTDDSDESMFVDFDGC